MWISMMAAKGPRHDFVRFGGPQTRDLQSSSGSKPSNTRPPATITGRANQVRLVRHHANRLRARWRILLHFLPAIQLVPRIQKIAVCRGRRSISRSPRRSAVLYRDSRNAIPRPCFCKRPPALSGRWFKWACAETGSFFALGFVFASLMGLRPISIAEPSDPFPPPSDRFRPTSNAHLRRPANAARPPRQGFAFRDGRTTRFPRPLQNAPDSPALHAAESASQPSMCAVSMFPFLAHVHEQEFCAAIEHAPSLRGE